MRLIVTIIFMLTSVYCACAQQTDEDYYLYKFDYERERVDVIIPDSSNWRKLEQQSGDIYGEVADYKFSFVDMSRRGFAFYERAKDAYAVIATGEEAIYANVILKKGVIKQ